MNSKKLNKEYKFIKATQNAKGVPLESDLSIFVPMT
jgi:hypothetical protein